MGPLNNEPTAAEDGPATSATRSSAARSSSPAARAPTGFPTDLYWQATVLDRVTDEMEVASEETFGPVIPISTISSDEEALQIVNASPYGLLTAVWTRDLAPRPALRRGRRRRLGERQRVDELLGEPSPVRRASWIELRSRPRRRRLLRCETFTEPKTVVLTLDPGPAV